MSTNNTATDTLTVCMAVRTSSRMDDVVLALHETTHHSVVSNTHVFSATFVVLRHHIHEVQVA